MSANMTPDPSLTEAEWAWCAGLFEGEGCIGIARHGPNSVALVLSMIDRDVVEKLDGLWPSANGLYVREYNGKPRYTWQVAARDRVLGFLTGIYPWLGRRRKARADEAFAVLARNRGINQPYCSHGHEMTGENVGRKPGTGLRYCRACQSDYGRRRARGRAAA